MCFPVRKIVLEKVCPQNLEVTNQSLGKARNVPARALEKNPEEEG